MYGKNNISKNSKAKGLREYVERSQKLQVEYKNILEVCPESIISLNERGEIIFWNGAAEKLFGYSRKEIFGKSLAMFTTRKDRERYTRIFNILKKLRTPKIATELQCIKRDGKEISVEFCISGYEQKHTRSFVVVVRDLMKRKDMEEELKSLVDMGNKMRMELGLKVTLQNICDTVVNTLGWRQVVLSLRDYSKGTSQSVAVAGYDEETTHKILSRPPIPVKLADRYFRDEFKISRSYYIDHTHWELTKDYPGGFIVTPQPDLPPDGWHEKDALLIPIYGKEKILGFISPDNPVNGKRPTESDIRLLEIFADQAGVAIGSSHLYAELQESEEKYRAVCENSLTAIYIFQDGKLRFVNRQFEKFSGYSRDELLGMEFWKLVHPEDREIVKERGLKRERGESVTPNYEFRGIKKNGRVIWFEAMASTIEYQGRRAVLGNLIDITERKMTKLELERYMGKLEQLNEAKSRFVSTFSHDIRTPLTTISGYTSLLLSKKWGDLAQEQEKRMRRILDSSRYVNDLVDDVLDLSRIELGKTPINPQKINPVEIIEKSIEDFVPITEEKEQSIKFTGDRSVTTAYADPKAMQRILNNLVDNAVKYTPRGGRIEVSLLEKKKFIQISVKDNGQGIPREELDNIFQEFYKLPNRSGDVTRSIGLGLSIVKRLVEAMGETLWVESEGVDKGSTFSFTLRRLK